MKNVLKYFTDGWKFVKKKHFEKCKGAGESIKVTKG